jgi:hypothetical protein
MISGGCVGWGWLEFISSTKIVALRGRFASHVGRSSSSSFLSFVVISIP